MKLDKNINNIINKFLVFVGYILTYTPYILLSYFLSNVLYLSFVSLFNFSLTTTIIFILRLLFLVVSLTYLKKYLYLFRSKSSFKVVALLTTLLIIILLRFPIGYPTFDDLAFHYFAGGYANTIWQNLHFMPMDWATYFYPAVDMMFTPFLYLVGIRFTIFLYFIFTSAWFVSLYSRFAKLGKSDLQKYLIFILFLLTPFIPHLMGTHGTLMVDYIALTAILETLYLFVQPKKDKTLAVILFLLTLLIKSSVSIFLIPLFGYFIIINLKRIRWLEVILISFISSFYFIRLYLETGNPLFNLYNGVFKSQLYSMKNFKNTRFGPENKTGILFWPLIGQFDIERFGEGDVPMHTRIIFSPLIIIPYLVSIFLAIKKRSLKYFIIFLSYILWTVVAGYSRYHIPLTIASLILLIFDIPKGIIIKSRDIKIYVSILLIIVLFFSTIKTDLSWRPQPSIETPDQNKIYLDKYKEGLPMIFQDTIGNLTRSQSSDFAGYSTIVTVHRGHITFYSYLASLNGLKVVQARTTGSMSLIDSDNKISDTLKNKMNNYVEDKIVLLALREKYEYLNTSELDIYKRYNCEFKSKAKPNPYSQRSSTNFSDINLYNCVIQSE